MQRSIKIKSIKKISWEGKVYNLAVDEDETYIANDIIAHNCRSVWLPVTQEEMDDGGYEVELTTGKNGKPITVDELTQNLGSTLQNKTF